MASKIILKTGNIIEVPKSIAEDLFEVKLSQWGYRKKVENQKFYEKINNQSFFFNTEDISVIIINEDNSES